MMKTVTINTWHTAMLAGKKAVNAMYVNVGNVDHSVEREKQNVSRFLEHCLPVVRAGYRIDSKHFFNMTCSLQAGRDCIHMRVYTHTHTPNSKGGQGSSATGHTAPEGD
jgi:negative regulator of replication initiation